MAQALARLEGVAGALDGVVDQLLRFRAQARGFGQSRLRLGAEAASDVLRLGPDALGRLVGRGAGLVTGATPFGDGLLGLCLEIARFDLRLLGPRGGVLEELHRLASKVLGGACELVG